MVSIIASKVVKYNRNNVGWVLVVESLILDCQVKLAVGSSSVLSSKMIVVQQRLLSRK